MSNQHRGQNRVFLDSLVCMMHHRCHDIGLFVRSTAFGATHEIEQMHVNHVIETEPAVFIENLIQIPMAQSKPTNILEIRCSTGPNQIDSIHTHVFISTNYRM